MKTKRPSIFKQFLTRLLNLMESMSQFYQAKIQPPLDRFVYRLKHNFIYREIGNTVKIFSLITIRITRKRRHAFYGYLFILIWLIGIAIFTLYPLGYSFYLSFHEAYYNLQEGVITTFIGFTNYVNIFRSQTLVPAYSNYLGRMVVAVPIIIVFSIIIAVLVNMPIKTKSLWRTVFFLPVIISTGPVINELNAQSAITLPNLQASGIYSYIVNNLPSFLADPLTTVINSMLLILWYAGIPILIYLAGLQKIDPSLYEAASMDGASPWMRFWKITLPSLMPFTGISIVYVVVSMSLFVEPGGILDLTRTHMLVGAPDSAFWFGYGYAAAMAWVYFICMVLLILVFTSLTREKRGKVK
ncbi:MAG: carbohydrate ABC transporter permease [Bacilli bacterium]